MRILASEGAPSGNETEVAQKLLKQGLRRSQLTVKGYLENRDDLATLLSTANLAIIPSRTEGFGLTALEALSAGLPFLVSQNSGFGEALHEIPYGSSWIVDSEDPEQWAKAIKAMREKGRETALKECQELRTHYAEKYSWEEQCNAQVERMLTLVRESDVEPNVVAPSHNRNQTANKKSEKKIEEEQLLASTNGERRQLNISSAEVTVFFSPSHSEVKSVFPENSSELMMEYP
ncbi:RNA endoribonuclease [Desmophyllum pertusum]|uniref:RNA endoribonuclease n=1 Tax=Desmophyllum pertusum TaxID=174260 RepID=A0A9W9Z9H5_9CNID|nr:RNA endoribonuclease [Desmophyllum pertusum]